MRGKYLFLCAAFLAAALACPANAAPDAVTHCKLVSGHAGNFDFRCDRPARLTSPVAAEGFVVLALGGKNESGIGWSRSTDQAQNTALKYCRANGGTQCRIVDIGQRTCLSLAESSPQNIRLWREQENPGESSGDRALTDCRKAGGMACKVTLAGCSDGQDDSYISLAISSTGRHALGWGNARTGADAAALKSCKEDNVPGCEIVQQAARTCIAVAGSGKDNVLVTASSWNIAEARSAAIQDCHSAGGKACSAFLDSCSDGEPRAAGTQGWSAFLPLAVNALAMLAALAFLIYKAVGARIAPPRPTGPTNALLAQLPVSFATSRTKSGMSLAVVLLLMVPCTDLLLWMAAASVTGAEKWSPGLIAVGTVGGALCLWLTAKLLYVHGYRLFRPDQLVISAQGLSLESLGDKRDWKWDEITDVRVGTAANKSLSKLLKLSLREGVPGYTIFNNRTNKLKQIWLGDSWATPSRFHSLEYLRDLIEAVRKAGQPS
ncbi:MAG: DUF4189 domain-containing protein [Pseudomonadota bacterium]